MTTHIDTGPRANLIGSFWMVAAMAAFAIEDMFIKATAATLPVGQILILFGFGGAVLFAGLTILNKERLFTAQVVSRPMRLRVVFEIMGRLFYVLAIALTPLSSATVILQATPIVVVASAALIFGEKVGWRRWVAIIIGLTGVLVILRPGSEGFSMLSVLGMLGFAGRDLASRAAPASLGTSVLGFYGFVSIVASGVLFSAWQGTAFVVPDTNAALFLLGAVLFGVVAYSALMKAMRTGQVSAVTPFRYTRLLFGVALGVALFGERLEFSMILGCGLIVLSGLFILWRGRQPT